jgi:hypothetical protein
MTEQIVHLVNAAAPAMRELLRRVSVGQLTPDEAVDVLLDWPDRGDPLRTELREAAETLRAVGKAALVVKPTLDKPYSDDPSQTPWSRFMEAPARAAYNLGTRLSR